MNQLRWNVHKEWAADLLDERGWLPEDEARRIVASADEYRVEPEWLERNGAAYKSSDELWLALLSLDDVAEFAREVERLRWRYGPRALQRNVDPFLRYGDGVIVWAETALGDDGDLRDGPGNLETCLILCGGRAAYDLVGRVLTKNGDASAGERVRDAWVRAHLDVAVGIATAGTGNGDWDAEVLTRADLLGATSESVERPDPHERELAILRELDRSVSTPDAWGQHGWPIFIRDHTALDHAKRVVGALDRDSDRWCVLIQQLGGDHWDHFSMRVWAFGSVAESGESESLEWFPDVDCVPEDAPAAVPVTAVGALGDLRILPEDIADPLLLPEDQELAEWAGVARMRFWIRAKEPEVWGDPVDLARRAMGVDAVDVVVCADRFRHEEYFGFEGDLLPSGQDTYRSIAEALAHRDPSLFRPGVSNVRFDDPERRAPEEW